MLTINFTSASASASSSSASLIKLFFLILFSISILLLLPLPTALADLRLLHCFDSQSAVPVRVSGCQSPEEVCYAEYYALNTTSSSSHGEGTGAGGGLAHFFDRFCVHRRHCMDRGLVLDQRPCLGIQQLDSVVARTFKQKLRSERLDPRRLVHSHFCCCASRDRCNELGPEELHRLFNVSVVDHPRRVRPRNRKGGGGAGQPHHQQHHEWWISGGGDVRKPSSSLLISLLGTSVPFVVLTIILKNVM